jgi:hypothetical protein
MNPQNDNTAALRTGLRRISRHGSSAISVPGQARALSAVPSWPALAPLRSWVVPLRRRLSGGQRSSWCLPRWHSRPATGSWLSPAPRLGTEPALPAPRPKKHSTPPAPPASQRPATNQNHDPDELTVSPIQGGQMRGTPRHDPFEFGMFNFPLSYDPERPQAMFSCFASLLTTCRSVCSASRLLRALNTSLLLAV